MGENGFDFQRRPAERREAKQFDPPPWERDAFDELQRRKAAEEPPQSQPAATAEPAVHETETAPTPAKTAENEGSSARGGLNEAVVLEMLAELAEEEPSTQKGVWRVALASALVLTGVGAATLIWGMAALVGSRTSGSVGTFGGTVLLLIGAACVGGAVWLVYRTLRQQGVL